MLDDFHRHRKATIASKVRALLESQFFAHHPLFRKKMSVFISGSVANDRYDALSDVDVEIVAHEERDLSKLTEYIKTWKRERGHPRMQIYAPVTLAEIRSRLEGWEHDAALRDVGNALIVHDPHDFFAKLQREFAWYPHDVLQEKLHWLYAEAFFALTERLPVALKRKDPFFPRVLTLHVVRLLLNALLMANKQFPAFDKHVFAEVRDLPGTPSTIVRRVKGILADPAPSLTEMWALTRLVEAYLLKRKAIPRLSDEAWLRLRPKYPVETSMK
ncbi:MAG: DUF4037 domain-containing protein [Candidatus Uhrbacteria bacterium]|nr:DUF4037 domain-containing protein [Candidatus Uhrbacteria bacterium]